MGCTSRARSSRRTILWTCTLVFLALVLNVKEVHAQSCVGKIAGDVCRPSAGSCDVAESCVATGGNPGAPMFQPADGALRTNVAWNYTMGYAFTPNKTITVTSLGGLFNGTKTVYLYDRSTGAVLASAPVTAANTWGYATIAPVTLMVGSPYSVAVALAGSGAAYRSGTAAMPRALVDATINGSCYRSSSTAEPCASSGLISGTIYGLADFKYLVAKGLYQPTDGTLTTDGPGDYTVGYAFTPNKNLMVTSLGGFFNGTRTVYLYNRSTGAMLASASATAANTWAYRRITPVTLMAGVSYTVAVYTAGTGGASRAGMTSMPSVLVDASVEGTCYRPASTAEPCAYSGLISGNNYGMADIQYTATGGGLSCPADTLKSAGTVCRSASGTCDLTETCSGSSAACPANLFKASGITCDDGQLCTYGDVCNGAGSCGGTTITCGGGNACSTTVCNGTSTCEAAKVYCTDPPGECYNMLGTCNTTNGSCSYTVKTGATCGTRGTCQSNGTCYTPPPISGNGVPQDCATQTIPAPVPIGCDSCDPSSPCVVDTTITVPLEFQTCSGYTPRKGDIVVHEADGLTRMLVSNFSSNPYSHIGVFLDPQSPGSNQAKQMVRHHALNLDGLADAAEEADILTQAFVAFSLNKNSAYCTSAKLNPAKLFDSGGFTAGVPNSHTADMVTELNGDTPPTLYWQQGIFKRDLIIAANRSTGEQVANRMLARNDYYSLNSLLDDAKGMSRLSGTKPGTNCASAIMSCVSPAVPRTLLKTDKIKATAFQAYEAIKYKVRHMEEVEDAVDTCKAAFCLGGYLPACPVDCNGIAWEIAKGIADQAITCILFGPTANGCECTRDNRKWHFANWAGAPPTSPTQDDLDWVNHRTTDVEFVQDTWTGAAASGQSVTTIYESYSYLPGDILKSGNYPESNKYPLIAKTNAIRKYGHCYVPLSVTGTMSPATSPYGTQIQWTATASGGVPSTTQYAFFRRPSGSSAWIPPATSPNWQTDNRFYWTPIASDVGYWDTYVWVKDHTTPANQNTHGYAASYNPGSVQVTGNILQNYPPKGWVDGYNTQHIWGWACDPDYPTESNRVDVYTTSGTYLGSVGAFIGSVAAINSACLGGTAHYFDFYPSGGIASGTHFNVWSIDLPYATAGNDNRKLGGNGSIGDGTEFVIP